MTGTPMTTTQRRFIAHRGVHLDSTIAGENSLEAVRLAGRAGFACVETDARLSADGELVVMHDETLNRTATTSSGEELGDPVHVADVPLAQLREGYRLKALDPAQHTHIPTLEEFLHECRRIGVLPFIELKLHDQAPGFYEHVLAVGDAVLGRGGYVITSNGNANRIIRRMGIRDVPLMDIRHQASSLEDVAALGDVTVAISAARYPRDEHAAHVAQARARGLATEAHADDFDAFTIADRHGVDLISTDVLAPDLRGEHVVIRHAHRPEDFTHVGHWSPGGELHLDPGATVILADSAHQVPFGGLFLRLCFVGDAAVRLGSQQFRVKERAAREVRYQLLTSREPAVFALTAAAPCRVTGLEVVMVEF